jgi:hypothetical protein
MVKMRSGSLKATTYASVCRGLPAKLAEIKRSLISPNIRLKRNAREIDREVKYIFLL